MLLLVLGAGIKTVIIAIAVTRIPSSTRVIRSVAIATREMLYVEAARVLAPQRRGSCSATSRRPASRRSW